MKKIKILSLLLCLALLFSALFVLSGCGDNGGDGKTTCKNCGKKEVVALGYCNRCYEGFKKVNYYGAR